MQLRVCIIVPPSQCPVCDTLSESWLSTPFTQSRRSSRPRQNIRVASRRARHIEHMPRLAISASGLPSRCQVTSKSRPSHVQVTAQETPRGRRRRPVGRAAARGLQGPPAQLNVTSAITSATAWRPLRDVGREDAVPAAAAAAAAAGCVSDRQGKGLRDGDCACMCAS